jgi:phosphatidylserine/phosphatidylglycerophosphate/cardiolipin synthase-like enzyme
MRTFNQKTIGEVSPTSAKIIPTIAEDFPKIVIPIIKAAKSSIDILVYEWKWYGYQAASAIQQFNLEITSAARRGVKVRVIMNIEHYSHPLTKINTRTERVLKQAGCEVIMARVGGRTHAKMIIVDKNILILGSHNFCKSSFSTNAEVSITLADCPVIEEYCRYFESLWMSRW